MGQKIQTDIIYFITGPTACGKTRTAIELAMLVNGEVISADSAQIYKYMNIGTAKPTIEEMRGIRHHLIDVLAPDAEYSAAMFQKMARGAISDIKNRGKTPIVAGGSGFYLNALLYNVDFASGEPNKTVRDKYMQIAAEYGSIYLYDLLREKDPESAAAIHANNIKRVVRALTFFDETGGKLSSHNREESNRRAPEDARLFILNLSRPLLYERINQRVDIMFDRGLAAEARRLTDMGYGKHLTSMQALGYKETLDYLENRCTLDEAKDRIKRATRHFAKRQITWFRHKCAGVWINIDDLRITDLIDMAKTSNIWK
ncbi:MAG: tRNA (adenosine(37)-N6)-dimethylallyltransferase MiaA [Clostridiales bacterium]|jgi:tRNA dimethylallyltransferase|nr:tRNA (adenosine(37)-N6)-dimethylallyltransferase MiaA [Clostridiales bacterium]